jgi:hypothetical protein
MLYRGGKGYELILYRNSLLERADHLDNLISEFCKMSWTNNPTLNEVFAIDQLQAETGKIMRVAMATFNNPGRLAIRPYKSSLLVTPGNGYLAAIEAICYQLLLHPVEMMVILSSRDLLGKAFADFIETKELGTRIQIVDPTLDHEEKRRKGYRFFPELAVIYGSSPTCRTWKNDLFAYTQAKVITYGTKASIGYHSQPLSLMRHLDDYAEDFFLYDGTGCLNTCALYVNTDSDNISKYQKQLAIVEEFARELGNRRDEFVLPYQGVQTLNHISATLLHSGKSFKQINGVFVREPVQAPILSGGHGTAMIVLTTGLEDIKWEWQGCEKDLSSATISGSSATLDINSPPVHALFDLGVSRVTRPGRAQHPTHLWRHDGRPILPNEMWEECSVDW